ncbi:HAD family phosphatase [Candidatus Falkowbacteria bacterium]|jgi:HAD superfamily hydrolase (TIGR01509 family)|nr:HAD family phosphatase [Candidatus Falkowbacteria bacterium]MBT4432896.1 HAD family phosphatase [Candidatus Falkowbacteria bacterium]
MIQAILFDRDGVIINSEKTNVFSAVQAFGDLGIVISEKDKEYIVGKHTLDYVEYFEKKYSFPLDMFLKIQKENYYKLFSSVEFFENTIKLIKRLKLKGYKIALTTSSHLDSTKTVFEKANLGEVFDVVVTFEDCKKRKPDPYPYLITAKKLGIKSSECLVIEDSVIGLESAKNAKMKCVVIPNEYTKKQDFTKADFIVKYPNEIEDILNNKNI